MNFRVKLFLSIVVAVLFTALAEAGLDSLATHVRKDIAREMKADLGEYAQSVADAFNLTGGLPRLNPASLDTLEPKGSYRLLRDQSVLLSSANFPEDRTHWATLERPLQESYRLEVALPQGFFERLLDSGIFWDLIDLPLWLAMAVVIAFIITRLVARPVRVLTRAVEQLSKEQFPEPVAVPRGNDELSQLAISFNRMIASLRDFMERERAFTRYASHELRTPLGIFQAQVESLEMGLAPAEKVIPTLVRNITRMRQVLTTLLALARSSEIDTDPVALAPILRELLETFPPEARARITLLDGKGLKITSARLVQQAVRNLVENAIKYSSGPVRLEVAERGENVEFCVVDTGPGVPEAVIEKVTEPFFRLSEHTQGLGLGLALVQHIARSLGGSFHLRNTETGLEACLVVPMYGGISMPERGASATPERRARI